ncbi:MAG: NADH-quinone oxidoreductase subunit NuoE [Proteobacteria bacterium]|nr:NADH-quinone oxidoreductase subunit NuoE [Pseudomonadota bacterium]
MTVKTLVAEAVNKYGDRKENLLPILQHIQSKEHHLSREALQEVAAALDLSSAEVYGTASFYSFLNTEECGKNIIKICKSISCDLKGRSEIVSTIENKLKIKAGQTTKDKKFSFIEVNCLGWCHQAPAMLINDKPYTELTPEKVVAALEEYK